MRVAPWSNLTLTLLSQQSSCGELWQAWCPETVLAMPAAVRAADAGCVDIVQLSQRAAGPGLPDLSHTCCLPCWPSATDRTPTPVPPIDQPAEDHDDIPPPSRPNPYYEPADGGGVGLIDLFA